MTREANRLLLGKGLREGIWDNAMAGEIYGWIMEIEEEGMVMVDRRSYVAEWSRVKGAEINFYLREWSAQVRCLRRGLVKRMKRWL